MPAISKPLIDQWADRIWRGLPRPEDFGVDPAFDDLDGSLMFINAQIMATGIVMPGVLCESGKKESRVEWEKRVYWNL